MQPLLICATVASVPDMKTELQKLKAEKWRLYCPQLNLWAGLQGLQIVPCATPVELRDAIFLPCPTVMKGDE